MLFVFIWLFFIIFSICFFFWEEKSLFVVFVSVLIWKLLVMIIFVKSFVIIVIGKGIKRVIKVKMS